MIAYDKSCIYVVSIIDIFTNYSKKKKVEHFFRTIVEGPTISCVDPEHYATRFKNFILKCFSS